MTRTEKTSYNSKQKARLAFKKNSQELLSCLEQKGVGKPRWFGTKPKSNHIREKWEENLRKITGFVRLRDSETRPVERSINKVAALFPVGLIKSKYK